MTDHDENVRRADEVRHRVVQVSPDEVLEGGRWGVVIDVRGPQEYAAAHLPGAVNIPLDELGERADEVLVARDVPVVTYCNGGNRGVLGAATLQRLGYTDVANLDGGLRAVHLDQQASAETGQA